MNIVSFKMAVLTIGIAGTFSFAKVNERTGSKESAIFNGRTGWNESGVYKEGSIRGSVTPAEGGVRAWAESAADTLKAPIINGSYEITDAKPGTYKVIIEAKPPYRNVAKDGIIVNDGQAADAGEIKLEK
jgi:hypothetical protein